MRIYKILDYDREGKVDQFKMAIFILKVSGHQQVAEKKNIRELLKLNT